MLAGALLALLALACVDLAEAGMPGYALGAQVLSPPAGLGSSGRIFCAVDENGVEYFGTHDNSVSSGPIYIASRLFGPTLIQIPSYAYAVPGFALSARSNAISLAPINNQGSSSCIYRLPTPNISASLSVLAGSCSITGMLDGTGTAARFYGIRALTAAADGTLYVVDAYHGPGLYGLDHSTYLRKVTNQGVTSTMIAAGQLTFGTFSGIAASFSLPSSSMNDGAFSLALSPLGMLYVIVKIDSSAPTLSVIYPDKPQQFLAASACTDGPLATASFNAPKHVAADTDGTIYVADNCLLGGAATLRMISGGIVSTLPLTGVPTQTPYTTEITSLSAGNGTVTFAVYGNFYTLASIRVLPGFYSSGSTLWPLPCPAGRFGNSSGLTSSACTGACPAGFACPNGTASPAQCVSGTWAAADAATCSLCATGRYGNNSGLTSSTCTGACPAGSACPSGTVVPVVCGAGSWAAVGSPSCSLCDAGRFGATVGLPLSACTGACPAGSACSNGTASPLQCAAGTWSATGAANCSPCDTGRYGNTAGLTASTCTGACQAGFACPSGTVTPVQCPAGTWAAAGSASCSSCDAGQYGSTAGLTVSTCTGACPAGSACPSGTVTPVQCAAGTWAAAGSASCSPCDAGWYGATAGLTVSTCTGVCPAGSGCASGTSSPTLCPVGTWSAAGSTCQPCRNGTYGNTTGLTSASCSGSCAFAPRGYVCNNLRESYYRNEGMVVTAVGAVQPALCPNNHYCPDSATILPCAAGAYVCLSGVGGCSWPVNTSKFIGLLSTTSMTATDDFGNPIPALHNIGNLGGLFNPLSGWTYSFSPTLVRGFSSPSCSGFVSPGYDGSQGLTSFSAVSYLYRSPRLSATGAYYEELSGSPKYIPSSPCPVGSFCPGATPAIPCFPGTYTPIAARASCLLCSSGTYQPLPGQSFCDGFCPAGTFSVSAGAANASACSPCPAGTYGLGEGSSACTPCPSGSYSTALGATSPATCIACPLGTSTLNTGAYSPKACVSGLAFVCPAGQQPSSPSTPASAADCAPLACASPLQLMPDGSGCSGCGAGTYGVPGACTACPIGSLCPGLLSLPLINFSSTLPGFSAPATSRQLAVASNLPSGCPLLQPPTAPAGSQTAASATLGSTTAVIAGCSILGVLLLVTLLATLNSRLLFLKLPPSFKPYLLLLDIMSVGRPMTVGAEKYLAERQRSTLGATSTLLAIGALGVLAAVLATQRAESNTLSQQSLGVLEGGTAAAAPWPWAQASSAAAASAALPAPSSGVFLRFTASGEPGQCQPSALTTAGLSAGAWALLPSSTCPGSRASTLSQFTLACPTCMFSPTSAITFLLPFSCQSLLVEAGAVKADGSLVVLSLPPSATSAPGGGALLSGVTWTLAPLLSQLNNTMSPGQSRKGWQLLSQGSTAAPAQQLPAANGTLTVLPLSSSVSVRINLVLQPYVATTTLTELTTVLQLLSSIVGFQGTIFAVVGLLFGLLTQSRDAAAALLSGRGGGPSPSLESAAIDAPKTVAAREEAPPEAPRGKVSLYRDV